MKQKCRRIYGVLERQFERYFERAEQKKGVTGEILLQYLEQRLDNVIYRLGLASSRPEARQLVRHGHFKVNDGKVNIPSYQVRPGDVIEVRRKSKDMNKFKELQELLATRIVPEWLEMDAENMEGRVLEVPTREQIDADVDEPMIVELYSR